MIFTDSNIENQRDFLDSHGLCALASYDFIDMFSMYPAPYPEGINNFISKIEAVRSDTLASISKLFTTLDKETFTLVCEKVYDIVDMMIRSVQGLKEQFNLITHENIRTLSNEPFNDEDNDVYEFLRTHSNLRYAHVFAFSPMTDPRSIVNNRSIARIKEITGKLEEKFRLKGGDGLKVLSNYNKELWLYCCYRNLDMLMDVQWWLVSHSRSELQDVHLYTELEDKFHETASLFISKKQFCKAIQKLISCKDPILDSDFNVLADPKNPKAVMAGWFSYLRDCDLIIKGSNKEIANVIYSDFDVELSESLLQKRTAAAIEYARYFKASD